MNKKYYAPLTVSSLLFISSCTPLYQSYQKPQIKINEQWSSQDKQTHITQQNTLKPDRWWKRFHDKNLNDLIDNALKNNNDLQIAAGHILSAQANLEKTQFSWLPSLNASGLALNGQISNVDLTLPRLSNQPVLQSLAQSASNLNQPVNFNAYMAGLVPSYNLNILLQLSQGQFAKANLNMQIAEQNAVRLSVVSQVAASYFSLLGLKQQLFLQEKMIQDAQTLERLTKVQYENGAISSLNLEGLAQFIALLEQKKPEIQADITKAQNAIHVLCNENLGIIQTKTQFTDLDTKGIIPIYLPSETLRRRPDVAIAEAQLEMAHAVIGISTAALFPSFNLTGIGGLASIELGNLLKFTNQIGVGQIIAGMPILNMQIYAEIKKAKGQKYALYYQYFKTVREALADVDNRLAQHASINQSYTQQKRALSKAKTQLALLNKQYQEGAIAYVDTLIAQINVDYMQACLNQIKIQQMLSIVNLYQTFAGGSGWRSATKE